MDALAHLAHQRGVIWLNKQPDIMISRRYMRPHNSCEFTSAMPIVDQPSAAAVACFIRMWRTFQKVKLL